MRQLEDVAALMFLVRAHVRHERLRSTLHSARSATSSLVISARRWGRLLAGSSRWSGTLRRCEVDVRVLVRPQEQHGAAGAAHARRAAYAVHEGVRVLRRVELHDPVDVWDIKPPRRYVGAAGPPPWLRGPFGTIRTSSFASWVPSFRAAA